MKKLKLLSSLSALLLVLSVGACDKNTEDSSSDEVTSSESDSSTSSSETTPAIVELSNYTISITFVDTEGETTAIPEYGTAYIIGGWDSWATFIPLTENEGKYTYTFDTITEGSYGYKVVEWYTDQDVDWNSATETNCVEITATDQTLVVSGSEGDNATHEITITLDVELPEPLTEEEIVLRVLQAAYEADEVGIPSVWDATHAEVNEDPEDGEYVTQDDIYLTSSSRQLYGYWKSVDLDWQTVTESYYISGTKYIHEVDEEQESETYSTLSVSDTYTSIFESSDTLDFFEVFEKAEGVLDDVETNGDMATLEALDYTFSDEGNAYTVSIKSETEWGVCTYTYATDRLYNLTSISFEDTDEEDGKAYTAEKASSDAIEEKMAGFSRKDGGEAWIEDNTITEMLATVAEGHNYYAENSYILYQSDVVSNTQAGRASANVSAVQWLECDEYATEDALFIYYYQIQYPYKYYYDAELYVNDYTNNTTKVYYITDQDEYYGYDDEDNFYFVLNLYDTWEGTWEENIANLGNLVDYRYAFSIEDSYSTGTFYYGDVEDYAVDESALETLLKATIGNNYYWDSYFGYPYGGWNYYFGYADAADIYSYTQYLSGGLYTYFDAILEFGFSDGGAWYYSGYNEDKTDYAKDDDGNYLIFYQEVGAYTDIYLDEIGKTEIPSAYAQYLEA